MEEVAVLPLNARKRHTASVIPRKGGVVLDDRRKERTAAGGVVWYSGVGARYTHARGVFWSSEGRATLHVMSGNLLLKLPEPCSVPPSIAQGWLNQRLSVTNMCGLSDAASTALHPRA